MTEQNPDSNLKEQDYGKWVKGQSTEALEKELRTLEAPATGPPKPGPRGGWSMEQ